MIYISMSNKFEKKWWINFFRNILGSKTRKKIVGGYNERNSGRSKMRETFVGTCKLRL